MKVDIEQYEVCFPKFPYGSIISNRSMAEANESVPSNKTIDQPWIGNASHHLPDCLIIGVRKGGTRAVQHFLSMNPKVVTNNIELNFFGSDDQYAKGLEWYLNQMPPAEPGQVLIEKTADYFQAWKAPERIHKMNSSIKMILVVRDPIERLISDYHFLQRYAERKNVSDFFLETKFSLEDLLVNSENGHIRCDYGGLYRSKYSRFFVNWLEWFDLQQIHVVNGDGLVNDNPATVLRPVERFLGLPSYASERDFYYEKDKGFWCLKASGCLGDEKGHKLPPLRPDVMKKVQAFLKPFNEEFYNLTGINFGWK